MAGKGKLFEQQVLKAFERELPRSLCHRIIDNYYGKGGGHKTPADILINSDAANLLIECKSRMTKSIPFNSLEEHQRDSLQLYSSMSLEHAGVVAVHLYNGKLGKQRFNKAYLVPWMAWNIFDITLDRKSISYKMLDADPNVVKLAWEKVGGKYTWTIPQGWRGALVPTAAEVISQQKVRDTTASVASRHTSVAKAIKGARKSGLSSKRTPRG